MISLEDMLAARDARAEKQRTLLAAHPGLTLAVLTVVWPGQIKRNADSLLTAKAAVEAMEKAFEGDIIYKEEQDLQTGYEAYWVIKNELHEVKRRTVEIEETHPLGRLFDLDVINAEGAPVSRTEVGAPPRCCLLCAHEARYCMRNKTHTYEEILRKIKEMTDSYGH